MFPVFRDREELPSGDLGEGIEAALKNSRALIIVCSPNAAASRWVNKEIETFLALGRRNSIFAIIHPDTPFTDADGRDATSALFPSALRGDGMEAGFELNAGDARKQRDGFRNAWLKVVAGMIGVNAGALQDRDRARRRTQRFRIASGVVVAILTLSWLFQTQDEWRPRMEAYWKYGRFAQKNSYELLQAAPAGMSFKDCGHVGDCPEMLVIPQIDYSSGDSLPSTGASAGDQTLSRFTVSRRWISVVEWRRCVAARGCSEEPLKRQQQASIDDPFRVTWEEAQIYAYWLSDVTGKRYRLLFQEEWQALFGSSASVDELKLANPLQNREPGVAEWYDDCQSPYTQPRVDCSISFASHHWSGGKVGSVKQDGGDPVDPAERRPFRVARM